MKVFISWSGERSRVVATALRDWLPDVIQDIEPWMSASDIEAGARWNRRVQDELSASRFGIICVTPENQTAPWLLFEAGALAKSIEETLVVPYLIGLSPGKLSAGPLTQFQAKSAIREDTFAIVTALNDALKQSSLPSEKLTKAFDRWWPDLEKSLGSLPPMRDSAPEIRSQDDMLEELLLLVREVRNDLYDGGWQNVAPVSLRAMGQRPLAPAFLPSPLDSPIVTPERVNDLVERVVNGVIERLKFATVATVQRSPSPESSEA